MKSCGQKPQKSRQGEREKGEKQVENGRDTMGSEGTATMEQVSEAKEQKRFD